MKRCKHQRISIMETGTMFTNHAREENGEWSHHSSTGDYNASIQVECLNCGFSARYGKRKPKWLLETLEEMESRDELV